MDSQGRILIVDDNPINVDILRRILRKTTSWRWPPTARSAWRRLPRSNPQLVLLDIMHAGHRRL